MKLIIAGSRHLKVSPEYIADILDQKLGSWSKVKEVVSGKARGIDTCGEHFASVYGIPTKVFPANWNLYGNAAGPIRNRQMAKYADVLLLIWDGKTNGSASMKSIMASMGKPTYEIVLGREI